MDVDNHEDGFFTAPLIRMHGILVIGRYGSGIGPPSVPIRSLSSSVPDFASFQTVKHIPVPVAEGPPRCPTGLS